MTPKAYVKYLNAYATAFELWKSIECRTKVESIRREINGNGHVLTIRKPDGVTEWICDAVAVCSGLHVNPHVPELRGIHRVPIVLHSSQLKTRSQFGADTNVVVLGAGETAMDIAHLAVTAPTKSVTLCHRDGFFCGPKVRLSLSTYESVRLIAQIIPRPVVARNGYKLVEGPPNKPVDTSVASLFDTAYVHPILQRSKLLWIYYDQWIKNMHWLISGTQEGPDQWVGHISKSRKYVDSGQLSILSSCRFTNEFSHVCQIRPCFTIYECRLPIQFMDP